MFSSAHSLVEIDVNLSISTCRPRFSNRFIKRPRIEECSPCIPQGYLLADQAFDSTTPIAAFGLRSEKIGTLGCDRQVFPDPADDNGLAEMPYTTPASI
jgi:hypothetical protein